MQFGKGCKILSFKQQCGGTVHSVKIECSRCEPRHSAGERASHRMDEITVAPAHGIESRVDIVGHTPDAVDDNIGCQQRIECAKYLRLIPGINHRIFRQIEMSHHPGSAHSSIGTSGADNSHRRLPHHRGQRLLDALLHGYCTRLTLPAVIRQPVVGQPHKVAVIPRSTTTLRGRRLLYGGIIDYYIILHFAGICVHISLFRDRCSHTDPTGNSTGIRDPPRG